MSAVFSQFDPVLSDPEPFLGMHPALPSEFFAGQEISEENFGGATGVLQGASFQDQDVRRIEELIHEHIISRVRPLSEEAATLISKTSLDKYHLIADRVCELASSDISHAALFSKASRILSDKTVQEIKKMSFFGYLQEGFKDYYLSDEEKIGYEQIAFRVVRPHAREDVGSLHRDHWFWEYYNFELPSDRARAKVWTQICGDPKQSGLLLCPGSHRVPGGFDVSKESGKLMFISKLDNNLPIKRFDGNLGDTVMFNYRNLHTGSLNTSAFTRVSIEITVMFKV